MLITLAVLTWVVTRVSATCASEYSQCFGIGYGGDSCCVAGYVCSISNEYYGSCEAESTANATSSFLVPTNPVCPNCLYVGRVSPDPNFPQFAFSGSGVIAIVTGTTITAKLVAIGGPVFFVPVIDGVNGTRFIVGETGTYLPEVFTIASELSSAGNHRVELYRDNEVAEPVTAFLGFSGTVTAPVPATRNIEVIGDSISAGYGDLGVEYHPNWVANPACHYSIQNSSWFETYGKVAADYFDAQLSTVARSGWGIYRGYGGSTTELIPTIYSTLLGNWSDALYSFSIDMDIVLVNLGTNDWSTGDPGLPFETAYLAFLHTIRQKNPNAHIFLTIGPLLGASDLAVADSRIAHVVGNFTAETGDTKISAFDFGTQNLGSDGQIPSGCDWHPSIAEHEIMGQILISEISAALGWQGTATTTTTTTTATTTTTTTTTTKTTATSKTSTTVSSTTTTPTSTTTNTSTTTSATKFSTTSTTGTPATTLASTTTTTSSKASITTTASISSTLSASVTKTSTTVCATLYGQCGGTGFIGPTCCTASTCTFSNVWYSQCL